MRREYTQMCLSKTVHINSLEKKCLLVFLVFIVLLELPSYRASAYGTTLLYVDPQDQQVFVGQLFTVNVSIASVSNLYGYQFSLSFDNSMLNALSVEDAGFLNSPTNIWNQEVNNTGGYVTLALTSLKPAPAKTGSSPPPLATVQFEAIGIGDSQVHLYKTVLADNQSLAISHTTTDGTVAVQRPAPKVSLSPRNNTGNINDIFTVNLTVEMVNDLRYWQAGMTFNPGVLECVSYTEGSFLETHGSTVWQPGTINNTVGIITPYGASLNEAGGVSGNGTLAFITFKVVNTGISSLILQDVLLLDSNYTRIETLAVENGYFELRSEQPTPPLAYFVYNPSNPYVGETVTFNASDSSASGGTIVSYAWDFGDSFQDHGIVVYHAYGGVDDYNVTLTVTDNNSLTDIFSEVVSVLPLPVGASIDVYTQRGGKGLNQSSDAFAPGELMVMTTYVTYNLAPVPQKLVTFDLYLPNGTMFTSRASVTDESGLALVTYLVPGSPVFGLYSINATTLFGAQSVSDFMRLRVGWLIEVKQVDPSDRNGNPKYNFKKGEPLYLSINLRNIRFDPEPATICVTVEDELGQFLLFSTDNHLAYPNETTIIMNVGPIPIDALVGNAVVYVFAAQWVGGPAFCPEVTASFWISYPHPDVAVMGLSAFPLETYVGNSVQVTVTVIDEYYLPQSFNITVYANTRTVRTLAIANLAPYVETNFTCVWDSYTYSPGQYVVSAYAEPVPGETDISDNRLAGGTVNLTSRTTPVHDVAATGVESAKSVIGLRYSTNLTVTVQNQGDYEETFNVTVYANAQAICTLDFNIISGSTTATVFTWNTTGFAYGNYALKAVADTIPGETDAADNTYIGNVSVHEGVPGDVSGTTPGVSDGVTNMKDVAYLVALFQTKPTKPNWNPNADVNNDGVVDMKDIAIAVYYFNNRE